ncbi:transcriptional repressor [Palleronia caenipelagi]|uniref:Transcriptional repressor n=1 Tax=Palleronia caenipelagi TaxID=2489174 RepID=A0A547PXS1_9RHOB|nr:transcriptional repressor [Palleronia caenipelagi]TRD18961.1 transcriptional repressor [Palleronia caenipelagi]
MSCPSFVPHDHAACRRDALSQAEALCAAEGARLTPIRRKVLEVLLKQPKSLGAYDILNQFAESGEPKQPPAIYRALDFLVERGLVHRLEKLNAYVACSCQGDSHVPAFLICRACDRVSEAPDITPRRLDAAAQTQGFRIERTVVEAVGLCEACAE